jgi:hypothetical protein
MHYTPCIIYMSCVDYVICTISMEAAEEALRTAIKAYENEAERLSAEAVSILKRTAIMTEGATKMIKLMQPTEENAEGQENAAVAAQNSGDSSAGSNDPTDRKVEEN